MDENLGVGEVIRGSLAVVGENGRAAALFVLLLSLLGAALEWGLSGLVAGFPDAITPPPWVLNYLGIGAGLGGLLTLVVFVVANYLLWEAMLRQGNYLHLPGGRRYFRFAGQAIVVALLTGFGFLLLIIPGLIFGARWAAAPAFLIADRKGVFEAMGNSWDMVRGHTTPVVLAFLLGVLVVMLLSGTVGAASVLGEGTGVGSIGLAESFLAQLLSNAATVLQTGLGMFLFQRLNGPSHAVRDVFA